MSSRPRSGAVESLGADQLEELARAIVDDGLATRELAVALDQLCSIGAARPRQPELRL